MRGLCAGSCRWCGFGLVFVEGWLGARCWVVRERPCGGFFVVGRVPGGFVPCGARFRACVENFIVDASIFVVSIDIRLTCVFDKLLSAIGGCLGTKSR